MRAHKIAQGSAATCSPIADGLDSVTTIASISPSDGILILDSTPELGLTTGLQLTLIKDLQSVGKVQIVKVTDTYAVANILPGSNTHVLSTGTTIQLLR